MLVGFLGGCGAVSTERPKRPVNPRPEDSMTAELRTIVTKNLISGDSISGVQCGSNGFCVVELSTAARHRHRDESEQEFLTNHDAGMFAGAYERTHAQRVKLGWVYEQPHEEYGEACGRSAFSKWTDRDGLRSVHTPAEVDERCVVVMTSLPFFTQVER